MNRARLALNVLLSGMFLFPLFYFVQTALGGAARPSVLKSDLLLTNLPNAPLFDQIQKLNHVMIATYVVKEGEDLWAICRRYNISQYTIRSSNDLREPVPFGRNHLAHSQSHGHALHGGKARES